MDISGSKAEPLKVNETTIDAYLRRFQWDFARYQYQGRQLNELVGQVQALAVKIEDELKMLSTSYADNTAALTAAQRRTVINLANSDFEDILNPDQIARLDVQDSENLLTVMVVVPKVLDQGNI